MAERSALAHGSSYSASVWWGCRDEYFSSAFYTRGVSADLLVIAAVRVDSCRADKAEAGLVGSVDTYGSARLSAADVHVLESEGVNEIPAALAEWLSLRTAISMVPAGGAETS